MESFLNVMLNIYKNFIMGMVWAWDKLSTPFINFGGQEIAIIEMLSWGALVTLFGILVVKLFL